MSPFCGLHTLVNLAAAAQTSILEVEKALRNGKGPIFERDF